MSLFEDISELFATAIDGQGNEAIVKSAYEDLLGYTDADTMDNAQARIDYWVEKLASGDLTADDFGGAFLEEANTNQGDLISATTFANNQTVVEAHQAAYDEDPDTTLEQFTTIASDNRVPDEESEEDSGTPGKTFTLTEGFDSGAAFTGTAGNDTFNAPLVDDPLDTGVVVQTLNGFDELDGAGGTNTLNATLNDDAGTPDLSNIQNLSLRSRDDDAKISLAQTDSAEQVLSDRSTNDLEVTGIQNAVTIGLDQITAGTTQTFSYADDVLGSTSATQELSLHNVGTTLSAVALDIDANGGDTITGIDAELSGVVNLELAAGDLSGVETLTLSGSGTAILETATDDFDDLESLAAADYAGDLTINAVGATFAELSVVTGEGDDTVALGDGIFAATNTDAVVNLGEGENTLAVADVTAQADIDGLDFAAGDITGVNTLALVSGVTLTGNAELDLDGIEPTNVVFEDTVTLDDNTLTLDNEGSELAVTFEENLTVDNNGGLTFLNAEALTLNIEEDFGATGGPADIAAAELTDLTVNVGDEDAFFGDIDVADGAAGEADQLTLTTAGAGAVAGTLAINGTSVNGVTLNNEGEGDRTFTLNGAADLKAEADGVAQTAGEGVTVAGAGEGDVTLSAASADANELVVDATGYEAGDVIVSLTDDAAVDATNFDGVDVVDVNSSTFDNTISDLAAGVAISISDDADVTLDDDVTARTVTLNTADVNSFVDATVTDLSLVAAVDTTLETLTGAALQTVDVEANDGSFELDNEFAMRDGSSQLGREFTLNLAGEDNITFDGGIAVGAGMDTVTINANGTGTQTFNTVDLSAATVDGTFNLAGAGEFTDLALELGTDLNGYTINLQGEQGVDIASFETATVDDSNSVTFVSEGGDENVIEDASGLTTGDGATIVVEGSQDLTIGSDTGLTLGGDTGANDEATLDASAFTGELTLNLVRGTDTDTADEQTVQLGAGDASIDIDEVATEAEEDVFSFVFNENGIGDVSFTKFSDASNSESDVLDFSELGIQRGVSTGELDAALDLADGGSSVAGSLSFERDGNDILITSGEFDGTVTIVGAENNLDNTNFAFDVA